MKIRESSHTATGILLLPSALNLLFAHYYVLLNYGVEIERHFPVYIDNVVGVVFDLGVLLALASLACWGKRERGLMAVFLITMVWAFCNVLYSRFFQSYISLSSVGQAGTLFDGLMLRCIVDGLRWSDVFFPANALLFWLLRSSGLRWQHAGCWRVWGAAMALAVLADLTGHGVFCLQHPERRYFSYYIGMMRDRHFGTKQFMCGPRFTNFTRGFVRTQCCELSIRLQGTMELEPGQRALIERLREKSLQSLSGEPADSTCRNVVFIIVESYMAFTSDLVIGGQEITPHLNALRHSPETFYNGQVMPNITIGESGDGQFIYMTGLLPLRSMLTISKACSNELPGLAKVLKERRGLQTRMVIPTVTTMWNQDKMSQRYGVDSLYCSDDYRGEHGSNLNDEQVFALAKELDGRSAEPFFSLILTMSMHQPYERDIDKNFVLNAPELTREQRSYLNACHYTDRCIGDYLEHLKRVGLYDSSLIVIAADHGVAKVSLQGDDSASCRSLPLYVVNGRSARRPMWQGACNQLDVYPTILDELGIAADWAGLGCSLTTADGYENSLTDEKWDASEWIIMSDYFAR